MIYILHGKDTEASYGRLSGLLAKSPKETTIKLSPTNTFDDFYQHAFGQDFFTDEKTIVCENFIKDKKIDKNLKIFQNLSKNTTIIFWEHDELTRALVSKFQNLAKVEIFKEKPRMFWFLDSLSPNAKTTLKSLANLKDDPKSLNWNLSLRLLHLIFLKLGVSQKDAEAFTGRKILDWQWQKLKTQSQMFELKSLVKLYGAILKIDYHTKTGRTSLEEKDLIPFALLKYLNP